MRELFTREARPQPDVVLDRVIVQIEDENPEFHSGSTSISCSRRRNFLPSAGHLGFAHDPTAHGNVSLVSSNITGEWHAAQ